MRKITRIAAVIVVAALVTPAFGDTLILRSGEKVTGYFQGGTARVIKFQTSDGVVKDYDLLSVQQIQFGDSNTAAAPAPAPSGAPSADPRLVAGNQRVTRPVSATAANTGFTIPTGSKIAIRMIDSISSEKNKAGDAFVAVLDEPVTQNGVEIIPKGVDIRGRLANVSSAGRVTVLPSWVWN